MSGNDSIPSLAGTTSTSASAGQTAPANTGGKAAAGGKVLPPTQQINAARSLDSVVEQLNHYMATHNRELHFEIDRTSGETIVRIVDPASGEVVRQIPREEVLALERRWRADGSGILSFLA